MIPLPLKATLQTILIREDISFINQFFLILCGASVLAIASQISIPLQPVPMTFQSVSAIFLGMAFGARHGAYMVGVYYLAGISGLPVFANFSAGPMVFLGPTGGYLLGFLPAAFLSGYLLEHGWAKNKLLCFSAALLATFIIFAMGILVLSNFIGFTNAIQVGLLPFIYTEIIKLLLLSFMVGNLWKPL